MSQLPQLSVVILCYRTGQAVKPFVYRVKELLIEAELNWEIILVGNYLPGTDDETPEVVRQLEIEDPQKVKAVVKPKEGMMGWDMRTGLAVTRGETIAVIDGDGQVPAEDIIRVYQQLKKDGCDLVKAYRVTRYDKKWRRFVSFIYNLIFRLLFPGTGWRDINAKPKIITRSVYQRLELKSDDWFIDAEIMIQARRLRLQVKEIPTVFYQLPFTRVSFINFKTNFEFLKNLLEARLIEWGILKK